MYYAKQRMIICGVVSLLFAGSALAQSHRGLEGIFQPWNAERRGGDIQIRDVLVQELTNFTMRITKNAHDTYFAAAPQPTR